MSIIVLSKYAAASVSPGASGKANLFYDNSTPPVLGFKPEDGSTIYQVDTTDAASAGSIAAVSSAYAAETYLAGSCCTLPVAGIWKAGATYQCTFDITKTAAGTATPIIKVYMGTLGTTGDTAIQTLTLAAGTAAADTGIFDVWVNFRSVGSGTAAVIASAYRVTKTLTTTGLTNTATIVAMAAGVASSGFNSTTQTKIGLSFNGGSLFVGANTFVQAQLMNI